MMSPNGYYYFGTILLLLLLFTDPNNNNNKATFALAFAPSITNVNPSRSSKEATTVLRATKSSFEDNDTNSNNNNNDRRRFLGSVLSATVAATGGLVWSGIPEPAVAAKPPKTRTRYVLDDETGDYIEVVEEDDWQKEWKSRYDQMSTMSKDEIFVAARGAGNIDTKDLANESPASKKRRAFSGCRDKATRAKLDNIDEKSCSKRVLEGDIEFVLNAL